MLNLIKSEKSPAPPTSATGHRSNSNSSSKCKTGTLDFKALDQLIQDDGCPYELRQPINGEKKRKKERKARSSQESS